MKLTFDQIESIYNCCLAGLYVDLGQMTIELNKLIEYETCHELALAQNIAVDAIEEYESGPYQPIYNDMFMRPMPPPYTTRAHLLRHLLDNEKDGKPINDGIAVIGNDKYWYPVTLEHSVNLHKHENYRIIK